MTIAQLAAQIQAKKKMLVKNRKTIEDLRVELRTAENELATAVTDSKSKDKKKAKEGAQTAKVKKKEVESLELRIEQLRNATDQALENQMALQEQHDLAVKGLREYQALRQEFMDYMTDELKGPLKQFTAQVRTKIEQAERAADQAESAIMNGQTEAAQKMVDSAQKLATEANELADRCDKYVSDGSAMRKKADAQRNLAYDDYHIDPADAKPIDRLWTDAMNLYGKAQGVAEKVKLLAEQGEASVAQAVTAVAAGGRTADSYAAMMDKLNDNLESILHRARGAVLKCENIVIIEPGKQFYDKLENFRAADGNLKMRETIIKGVESTMAYIKIADERLGKYLKLLRKTFQSGVKRIPKDFIGPLNDQINRAKTIVLDADAFEQAWTRGVGTCEDAYATFQRSTKV